MKGCPDCARRAKDEEAINRVWSVLSYVACSCFIMGGVYELTQGRAGILVGFGVAYLCLLLFKIGVWIYARRVCPRKED